MKTLDCSSMACPGPVVQTKKELEDTKPGESFVVIVDSEASRDNVQRFALSKGAKVEIGEDENGVYRLILTAAKKDSVLAEAAPPVVFIAGDTVGTGDDRLGRILMEGFINALPDQEEVPDRIIMMNSGVTFAVEGSPVLETLKRMADKGCDILVCGTCLDFFDLKEKLQTGVVSNMYEIQRTMLAASSVIRP